MNTLNCVLTVTLSKRPDTTNAMVNLILNVVYYIMDLSAGGYTKMYDCFVIPNHYPSLMMNLFAAKEHRRFKHLLRMNQPLVDMEGEKYSIWECETVDEAFCFDEPQPLLRKPAVQKYFDSHTIGDKYPSLILEEDWVAEAEAYHTLQVFHIRYDIFSKNSSIACLVV